VVIPWFVLVVDDGGAEAPGGVDAGAGDGDGGQVDHEHGEPDGERRQHLRNSHTHTHTNRSAKSTTSEPIKAACCFFQNKKGKKKELSFPRTKSSLGTRLDATLGAEHFPVLLDMAPISQSVSVRGAVRDGTWNDQ
jgi:hypothetical protein